MAATPYPAYGGVLFVDPVSEAPPGRMPDGGWRLIRPTVSAVCRPDKRSAIGQSVTPALLKRAARTTLRLRRAAPVRTAQW